MKKTTETFGNIRMGMLCSQIAQNIWLAFCNSVLLDKRRYVERFGSEYGGWSFIPTNINSNSIVYSAGIGEDITFDLALIEKYECHVYAFDPTPRSIAWLKSQELPEKYKWFELGIADSDGKARFFPPENKEFISHTVLHRQSLNTEPIMVEFRKVSSLLKILNNSKIDLLKMDIEGAEYAVIDNLIQEGIIPGQILVEFHHFFPGVSLWNTIRSTISLCMSNYSLFHISPSGHEYSFLYMGKSTDESA